MQKLFSTPTHDHYLSHFEGVPIRIAQDRKTGEILFDAESIAECLGFASAHDMMSRDEVLDLISGHLKTEQQSPIRRINPINSQHL